MLGSHLKYQQSRKDARDKIESEDVSLDYCRPLINFPSLRFLAENL